MARKANICILLYLLLKYFPSDVQQHDDPREERQAVQKVSKEKQHFTNCKYKISLLFTKEKGKKYSVKRTETLRNSHKKAEMEINSEKHIPSRMGNEKWKNNRRSFLAQCNQVLQLNPPILPFFISYISHLFTSLTIKRHSVSFMVSNKQPPKQIWFN